MFGEPIFTYTADQAVEDGLLYRVPAELSRASPCGVELRIERGRHRPRAPPEAGR